MRVSFFQTVAVAAFLGMTAQASKPVHMDTLSVAQTVSQSASLFAEAADLVSFAVSHSHDTPALNNFLVQTSNNIADFVDQLPKSEFARAEKMFGQLASDAILMLTNNGPAAPLKGSPQKQFSQTKRTNSSGPSYAAQAADFLAQLQSMPEFTDSLESITNSLAQLYPEDEPMDLHELVQTGIDSLDLLDALL